MISCNQSYRILSHHLRTLLSSGKYPQELQLNIYGIFSSDANFWTKLCMYKNMFVFCVASYTFINFRWTFPGPIFSSLLLCSSCLCTLMQNITFCLKKINFLKNEFILKSRKFKVEFWNFLQKLEFWGFFASIGFFFTKIEFLGFLPKLDFSDFEQKLGFCRSVLR